MLLKSLGPPLQTHTHMLGANTSATPQPLWQLLHCSPHAPVLLFPGAFLLLMLPCIVPLPQQQKEYKVSLLAYMPRGMNGMDSWWLLASTAQ